MSSNPWTPLLAISFASVADEFADLSIAVPLVGRDELARSFHLSERNKWPQRDANNYVSPPLIAIRAEWMRLDQKRCGVASATTNRRCHRRLSVHH
jgi:hypothetical protein